NNTSTTAGEIQTWVKAKVHIAICLLSTSCWVNQFLNCENCFLNAAGPYLRDCLRHWRSTRAPGHSNSPGESADATGAIVQKVNVFTPCCASRLISGPRDFRSLPVSMKR